MQCGAEYACYHRHIGAEPSAHCLVYTHTHTHAAHCTSSAPKNVIHTTHRRGRPVHTRRAQANWKNEEERVLLVCGCFVGAAAPPSSRPPPPPLLLLLLLEPMPWQWIGMCVVSSQRPVAQMFCFALDASNIYSEREKSVCALCALRVFPVSVFSINSRYLSSFSTHKK